jgi:ABC-type lipoprotein export system ATPase subunit
MIKLNNINKYYNKDKLSEIHVLNNITLDFPKKGIVVLLGPSGSGKTTLLNVLSGLDKINSGSIQFKDQLITSYKANKWDRIRNYSIGYVFQNYNLLNNKSVFDNISLTLNMIGVEDKHEIDKRVKYILKNVGMINYQKRKANQLSGGQQQRVAIARALAKNPDVIIADEPTGNLDSENTISIMNIIKNISKTKLVILVTHEEKLASIYANRIIKMKDGIIVEDYSNQPSIKLQINTSKENKKRNIINDQGILHNLDSISSNNHLNSKKSIITVKESLKMSLTRLYNSTMLSKLLYLSFIGVSVLIAIAIGMLSNIYYFDSDKFLTEAKENVIIQYNDFTIDDLLQYENDDSIDYVNLVNDSNIMNIVLPPVYQANFGTTVFNSIPSISDYLDTTDIIIGENVQDYNEIVIDRIEAEKLLKLMSLQNLGVSTLNDLLNIDITISLKGVNSTYIYTLDIVGICDTGSPVYYVKEETMYMIETEIAVYEIFKDSITFSEGELTDDIENAIMLNNPDDTTTMDLLTITLLTNNLNISGLYETTEELIPEIMMPLDLLKELYYTVNYTTIGKDLIIHSNNISKTIKYFDNLGIEATSLYDTEKAEYRLIKLSESSSTFVFTVMIIGAMSLSFFFIIRSSLLSRIYEVSIFRALGVIKRDIRKIFIVESILITTITSILGYTVTTLFLLKIQNLTEDYFQLIHISLLSFISGIALIYLVNILSGVLPVSMLLKKTPAEILSGYDY